MLKVAIVGNIASGKSEVQKYLAEKDFVVLDTDMMTHDILMDKPDVAEAFEDYDVFEYGRLSKEKLGKLVFSNPELKEKLEDIVHPFIIQEIENAFKTYSDEKYLFIAIPLLFEVGWESLFDKIIFVSSDDNLRLERLMNRNNLSEADAMLRINSQLPQTEKLDKADVIISNNSSKEELYNSIENMLKTW
ncbi:MAG: dephospho-CoA kinase [Candidatus Gastranaerophilales bacterium]|nr:dephospho-CoA kinase [Candidatus Gastranaerophilales bacterium]